MDIENIFPGWIQRIYFQDGYREYISRMDIENIFPGWILLLLLLKDNPSFNDVGVGAPFRPKVSKDNVSTTLVGVVGE